MDAFQSRINQSVGGLLLLRKKVQPACRSFYRWLMSLWLCAGLDVPSCRLVIRLDTRFTPIQMIQSRGRAFPPKSLLCH